jgi:hypothetical protein
LQWQAEHDLTCHGCGHHRDESMNPDLADAWDVTSVRCFACEAKALAEGRARDGGPDDTHGLYFVAQRDDD